MHPPVAPHSSIGTMPRSTAARYHGSLVTNPRVATVLALTGVALLLTAVPAVASAPVSASTLASASAPSSATDTVTNCHASGPGSLPDVVGSAAPGDTVVFSVSCPPDAPLTVDQPLDLTQDITISGPGPKAMVVSADAKSAVFEVAAGVTASISGMVVEDGAGNYDGGGIVNSGTLTLSDSTVQGNSGGVGGGLSNLGGATLAVSDTTFISNDASDVGGAIFNDSGSTATITASTLSYNEADAGGAIDNEGTMTVSDSTLSNDAASGDNGGAILNYGTLWLWASTVADNDANGVGGGLANDGSATAAATIVAHSYAGADCAGPVTDAGYNLDDDGSCGFSAAAHSQSDVDPGLGPLENNGGATDTQAPATDSPALDRIPTGTDVDGTLLCPGTDQRGVARPQATDCDVGAVELVAQAQAVTSADSTTATVRVPLSFTVTTSGIPIPSLTEKGRLPRTLSFTDQGNGTAVLAGTPKKAGTYHLVITAHFGQTSVTQPFTLTVGRG
jgi:hypothetical protein